MKPKLSTLKKKADTFYSKYRRMSAADHQGYVRCYTCNKLIPWQDAQLGHYVSRNISILRYHEKNTKIQCCGCNVFGSGRLDVFALNLVKEYGVKILDELNYLKNQIYQLTIGELQAKIEAWKEKISKMERS